jgi:hypothetical protein
MTNLTIRFLLPVVLSISWICEAVAARGSFFQVGVAKTDITPDYPIRLSGYGGRRTESEGVAQRIFAKALAIGSDKEGTALLLTVDNVAVPEYLRNELARRLAKAKGIEQERIAVCSTHTHTAPMLTDVVPNLFGMDIPPDQQERIDRYTKELTDKLEQVALAALKDRKPAKLSWGQAKAGFAKNRRAQSGPVDHDLPMLVATDKSGRLRAVFVSYACHCTTLGGDFNQVCGDWAGYAQEYLERDHPDALALVALGCGADADPFPRTGLEFAKQNGQAIATAVNELLSTKLTPLSRQLECRTKRILLPFDTPRSREEWEQRAKSEDSWIVHHARRNLARLDRGEKLPASLPYLIQTWNFGNELAMVFLPGEVVVDYALRLKKEFDAARLWVNAYANDVPCYIPSKRIWREGGYEGGDAMIYFDRPTRLAEQTQELIVAVVHDLLPKRFLADPRKTEAALPEQSASPAAAR